jgi:hypothetical protein
VEYRNAQISGQNGVFVVTGTEGEAQASVSVEHLSAFDQAGNDVLVSGDVSAMMAPVIKCKTCTCTASGCTCQDCTITGAIAAPGEEQAQ